jgi:biopolymer transport protein ExbD
MAKKLKKLKQKDLDLLPIMNLFTILIPFLLSMASFQKLAIVEVSLPERTDMVMDNETPPEPDDQALNLSVAISKDYLQIVARGGMLPMIFYKEMWTFRCKSDGDSITYSPSEISETEPPKCRDGKALDKEKYKYSIETIHLWAINKQTEEDPGTLLTSLYSASDSAYMDGNNEFINDKQGVQPGTVLATLAESSSRRITPEDYGKMKVLPRSAYDELAKALISIHNRFIDATDADNIIVVADDDAAFDKVINVMDRARDAGFWKINLAKLGG